ncbi:cytosolic carboxypeptidase Nna1-like [Schistocerca americana]|uniref:cytosolic carboxypeptidase Nna1-like n=1 Tax=Schistocerca americana TaxID=7009 RepID=UPI001F4F35FF|nr:cytosolic carboxypeptidase Nna1-like [Schistocerca americana]
MDSGALVKQLQAALFPICSKGSYLSSFLQNTLKSNQVEINTDNRTLRPVAKLKEPRDLFALPKELDCPQQAARWPTECQVLEERVQHIEYIPAMPEQYYQPTGREVQPKPIGEESGTVVFQYYPMSAVNYFSRSSVGGSKYFMDASPVENPDELRFESRFESGNLAKVVKITDTYYELYLRTDLYTNRHMQWFYFRIENTRSCIMYRFSIVNLSKADSLYSAGMKPLMYSTKDAQLNGIGWRRFGDNITYFRNDPVNGEEDQAPTYTLTFTTEFPYDNDLVYMAHCYPYTYSDLQDYLIRLQNHPIKSTYSKLRLLCRSLAGNNVYYLTITAPSYGEESKKKKAIVVTARVHPGETPSSWMMKGFMDFLTGDSGQAKELREKFIFKLVPMLNPDGVIVGNNRCSLTGRDLNRQYRTVIRETYPPVWHTKLMIRRLIEECGIEMYCDLHAHSRKHNVFMYGCESRRIGDRRLQEQVFPLMLHKNAADKFSFENCKFRIQRSKEGTGRVVVWMMGVTNSYTMEASFGGSTLGSRTDTHFHSQDYEQMGRYFCETLLDFCDQEPSKIVNAAKKERLRVKIVTRLMKEGSSADEPTNITLSDYSSDEGGTSSCSEDEMMHYKQEFTDECYQSLSVPPPSPVLPHREHHKTANKERSVPEKTTPSPQRKVLQVHKTVIDLSAGDTGSDYCEPPTDMDSGEESSPCHRSSNKNKSSSDIKFVKYGERLDMPPELIVTPAQFQISETPMAMDITERLTVTEEQQFVEKRIHTYNWYHARCPPLSRATAAPGYWQNTVGDLASEVQVKLGTTLRQKLWTALPCSCHGTLDTHWSGHLSAHDMLLRSCSKKLVALQRTGGISFDTSRNVTSASHQQRNVQSTDADNRGHTSLKWKRYRKLTEIPTSDITIQLTQQALQSGSDTEPGPSHQADTAKKKKKKRKTTHSRKGRRLQSASGHCSPKKITKS